MAGSRQAGRGFNTAGPRTLLLHKIVCPLSLRPSRSHVREMSEKVILRKTQQQQHSYSYSCSMIDPKGALEMRPYLSEGGREYGS